MCGYTGANQCPPVFNVLLMHFSPWPAAVCRLLPAAMSGRSLPAVPGASPGGGALNITSAGLSDEEGEAPYAEPCCVEDLQSVMRSQVCASLCEVGSVGKEKLADSAMQCTLAGWCDAAGISGHCLLPFRFGPGCV